MINPTKITLKHYTWKIEKPLSKIDLSIYTISKYRYYKYQIQSLKFHIEPALVRNNNLSENSTYIY